MKKKHSFIYEATGGKREQLEPIDCLDESGRILFNKWKKQRKLKEVKK